MAGPTADPVPTQDTDPALEDSGKPSHKKHGDEEGRRRSSFSGHMPSAPHGTPQLQRRIMLETLTPTTPRSYFGEVAIFKSTRRAASVITAEPCDFLVLHKAHFDTLCELVPDLEMRLDQQARLLAGIRQSVWQSRQDAPHDFLQSRSNITLQLSIDALTARQNPFTLRYGVKADLLQGVRQWHDRAVGTHCSTRLPTSTTLTGLSSAIQSIQQHRSQALELLPEGSEPDVHKGALPKE